MTFTMPVKIHKTSYPAIDPSRAELSQHDRNILITGGATGIGFEIARSFAQAEASTVFLTGRREDRLLAAVARLDAEFPKTTFINKVVDVSDSAAAKDLWNGFEADNIVIDVLVLSAARIPTDKATLLDYGCTKLSDDFKTNAIAHVMHAEYFYHQQKRAPGKKLFLVSICTSGAHDFDTNNTYPAYAASKNAGLLIMQLLAQDYSAGDMQIISFHPGYIATESAEKMGFTDPSLPWDDKNLPGHYAVWAASEDAAFLHGRFTWAAWDVDDLRIGEVGQRIQQDNKYLRVGIHGL